MDESLPSPSGGAVEPLRCPVCSCPLEDGEDAIPRIACERCGTVHHQDCWEFNGGCAVYGCRESAPPERIEMERWPEVLKDYMSWLQLLSRSRAAVLVFIASCVISAHLAVLGSFIGLDWPVILLSAVPMLISGGAFVMLEKRILRLQGKLEPLTGDDPFVSMVSARDAARWMAGAGRAAGALGPSRNLGYLLMFFVISALMLSIESVLPLRILVPLLAFDVFAVYMVGDSFLGMRRRQAILLERFKASFRPRLEEAKGTKKEGV